jgi:hypothetical protein
MENNLFVRIKSYKTQVQGEFYSVPVKCLVTKICNPERCNLSSIVEPMACFSVRTNQALVKRFQFSIAQTCRIRI